MAGGIRGGLRLQNEPTIPILTDPCHPSSFYSMRFWKIQNVICVYNVEIVTQTRSYDIYMVYTFLTRQFHLHRHLVSFYLMAYL